MNSGVNRGIGEIYLRQRALSLCTVDLQTRMAHDQSRLAKTMLQATFRFYILLFDDLLSNLILENLEDQ